MKPGERINDKLSEKLFAFGMDLDDIEAAQALEAKAEELERLKRGQHDGGEVQASREAIMDLVHRYAGDDRLEEFGAAVAALERDAAYHWRTEFEACHDELTEERARAARLEALARKALAIQEANHGNGVQTHLKLHAWAEEARATLRG